MSELMYPPSQDEDWKRELGHVLCARWKLIVATALLVFAGAILIALFWPSTYVASSSLLVLGKRAQISSSALDAVEFRNPEVSSKDIVSELEIIRSPELARRVARLLDEPAADSAEGAHTAEKEAAQAFLSHLDVIGVADSNAIRLKFYAQSALAAETGLETLLDEYIQYRAEVFNPVGQDQFFADRMEHYRKQLKDLVTRINGEEGDLSPAFIDQVITGNLARLVQLQQQQSDLEMELAVSTYVDNSPITTRLEMLKTAVDRLQKETNEIQGKRLLADSVFREAELISHSFDTFAKRAEEAKINDSIARSRLAGDISILSRAADTAELVFPRKGSTLLLGVIVALITGLSVGLLAEFFDHTVRRPEDVQKNIGLPVLCSFSLLDED